MKSLVLVVLAFMLGALTIATSAAVRESSITDVNGQVIHVGDLIQGNAPGSPVVKVHGFTKAARRGTFAAFNYQVHVCTGCAWSETSPSAKVTIIDRILDHLMVPLSATDGDAIVWGS